MSTTASEALFARAAAVSPGGVNSPVRAFRAVGGTPRFMTSRPRRVRRSTSTTASTSTSSARGVRCSSATRTPRSSRPSSAAAAPRHCRSARPAEPEVALAEEIVARVAPVERVRLVSRGTEATMSAIRLARGFTGRDQGREVRRLLPRSRRRAARRGRLRRRRPSALPEYAGVPAHVTADTIVLPYNDLAAVERGVRRARRPRSRASSPRPPPATWASSRRARLQRRPRRAVPRARRAVHQRRGHDRLPRLARGLVRARRRSRAGARPHDLRQGHRRRASRRPRSAAAPTSWTQLAPAGPVYQAGTLSGNPVATAAGLATLRACTPEVYARLDRHVGAGAARWSPTRSTEAGVAHSHCRRAGNHVHRLLGVDRAGARLRRRPGAGAVALQRRSSTRMLDAGVYLPPSAFEAWFVSAAHDDDALEPRSRLADALPAAARAAAAAAR